MIRRPKPWTVVAPVLASVMALGGAASAAAAPAERAFALAGTSLVAFDPDAPATTTSTAITGVAAGETLAGLDIRPQNGMLYGLGVNGTTDTATLYVVGRQTAVAAPVGPTGSVAFTTDGVTPVDLPGADYGFDVNPSADRIRVTTATGLNFRINPNTGVAVDGNAGTAGTNPDGPINGVMTGISGAAYTNARPLETVTTLYTLGPATHKLMIQNPPNNGTQTNPMDVTLGGTPVSFSAVGGFDIDPAATTATSNAPATGDGYAILTAGATTHLYRIALADGAAADLGPIGNGTGPFRGLALQRDLADGGFPAVGLSASGAALRRFATAAPDTGATATLTGIAAGETMVAVAWRPQTGQLLGLGVDSAADTGTLYAVDPQGGGATAIGAAGGVAWVDASSSAIDLPAASAGWGIDVSPASDRVRVVAGGGLNARVNPNTGTPLDGDAGTPGTNPDTSQTGLPLGATGVTATSYTNAFTQLLGAGATTQYVLEPATNQLLIQNPPNAGMLTAGKTITLGGAPLDFGAVAGFDIPGEVAVTTSGAAASGEAIAALTVGGTPGVYRIDLATGAATLLGATSTAVAGVAVGDAQRAAPVPAGPGGGGGGGGGGTTPTPASPAPAGPGPIAPPPVAVSDRTPPRVAKLKITARSRRRLTITFTTSEPGSATIRLLRETPGRRKGKTCVAQRRTGARCTIRKAYGQLTKSVTKAGTVTFTVTGKVHGKALAVGALRVEATARDAAGNRSATLAKSGRVKR